MKMKAVDKYTNKAIINLTLNKFLKKKKEPFFKGYKNPWHFKIKPIELGDKYD